MDFNVNFGAGTVQLGNKTYTFDQLNVPSSAKTEGQVQKYLNGIDLSKFIEKSNGTDSFTNSADGTTKTPEQIQAEIDKLNAKKTENYENIDKIEAKIEELIKKAEAKVEEAKDKQEKKIADHEDATKEAVRKEMQAYVEANKNGEGMTKDQLSENLKKALPNTPSMADAIACLTEAHGIVDEIDSHVFNLKGLIYSTQDIENQIDEKTKAKEAAEAAAAAQNSSSGGCCDPIGFEYNGEKFDFIVDDGAFDSTSDFLGAQNQWEAMKALDTDGNGTVDSNELKSGNIKAVKTDKEGNKSVVDLSEMFGDNFSIDLNSYAQGGSFDGIDTTADADGDGIADQQLLGTFNVNVKGESVKGYNTLDDSDWLSSNYGVTNAGQAQENNNNGLTLNETLQNHMKKADGYLESTERIKDEINQAYKDLGMTDEEIEAMDEVISAEAVLNAKNFFEGLTNKADGDNNNGSDNEQDEEERRRQEQAA